MPDQDLHLRIYILLFRQIVFRRIGMKDFCFGTLKLLHFAISLFDDVERLPHFLVAHQETIIVVAGLPYGNTELKIFITGIRTMHTNIIVNSGSAQVRSGKSIIQRAFCTDSTRARGSFHKNPLRLKGFHSSILGYSARNFSNF